MVLGNMCFGHEQNQKRAGDAGAAGVLGDVLLIPRLTRRRRLLGR